MNLDALVAPLRADVVSGAAVVSRTAAEVVRRVAVRAPADDAAALRDTLAGLSVRILDAQPSMAPLVALLSDVLNALNGVSDLEEARREAARTAESFRGAVEERTRKVGRKAARLLPDGASVVTLSASSTVRATLTEGVGRGLRAICLESRPMSEGRTLAGALADAGVAVTLAVDTAAESLLPGSDAVLLGADSIGDRGIVNKIGSRALARSARACGVPVWVLADGTKVLPPGFPQPVDDARPGEEVWRAPAGVRIWNRYFEVVPDELVDRVVTEQGAATPAEVHDARRSRTVPPELAAWAERVGSGGAADEEQDDNA